jgi:hypothetical protein
MQPREALNAAVVAGIVSTDQADRLVVFLAPYFREEALEAAPAVPPLPMAPTLPADPDEEEVHFARGFQDVFMAIGVSILLVGLGIGLPMAIGPIGGLFGSALIAWLLAEYFARARMLVLPSMVLAVGVTLFVAVGVGAVLTGEGWELLESAGEEAGMMGSLLAVALAGLFAALVFFARFRLPFALLVVAVAATASALAALELAQPGFVQAFWLPVLLGAGIVSFLAAMAFDVSDPMRRTLRSDDAFWLHLFAAPLIVHAVISLLAGPGESNFSGGEAAAVIAVVLGLALVALVIDRRALLVSGLSYLGFAIGALMQQSQLSATGLAAATLILLGAFVVALGAGWKPARALLIGWLPPGGIARYLPPVRRPAVA